MFLKTWWFSCLNSMGKSVDAVLICLNFMGRMWTQRLLKCYPIKTWSEKTQILIFMLNLYKKCWIIKIQ